MSRIRIISGTFGGRFIETPRGHATHPMGDRERSALFNSLQGKISSRRILDAFAGSGALGLEALSRGAEFAMFLEKDPTALKAIKQNIANLGLEKQTKIASKTYQLEGRKFDLIFADPPYDKPQLDFTLSLPQYLDKNGLFVLSLPKTIPTPEIANHALIFDKTYATARIRIYRQAP